MKFSTKLTILFSGIVLIIGASISYLAYTTNIRILEDHIKDRLRSQTSHAMRDVDVMLSERYADIKELASDPVISARTSTPGQIMKRLSEYESRYNIYISLSFFNLNRIRIADTSGQDIGKQHLLTEYWPDIVQGKDIVTNISQSESQKTPLFHFVSLVKDRNGIPFGVVVSRLPLKAVNNIIKEAMGIDSYKKDLEIYLVDRNGLVLYTNFDNEEILKDIHHDWDFIKKLQSTGNKSGTVIHTSPKEKTGEEVIVFASEQGYVDFKGSDWTLIADIPTKIAFASAVELKNKVMIILITASFFAFFIVYFSSRKVSSIIEKMGIASSEIGRGNLDVRIESTSKDETGRLADAFNKMVSDLKERTAELEIAKLEAEIAGLEADSANKAKSEFLANMSHELRTPLSAIMGFSQLIAGGMVGPITQEQKEFADGIFESSEHLLSLINDILDLSKVEAGKMELELGEFSLKHLLERSFFIVKDKALKHQIKLTIDISDDIERIVADERKIKQVVYNLLSNAIKFTPDNGSVHINARRISSQQSGVSSQRLATGDYQLAADLIEVSVVDTGIGISSENIGKLFQPFQQLNSGLSSRYAGTGLGLNLCKKFIELHGGKIWAESEPGKGSKFIFTIPVRT